MARVLFCSYDGSFSFRLFFLFFLCLAYKGLGCCDGWGLCYGLLDMWYKDNDDEGGLCLCVKCFCVI